MKEVWKSIPHYNMYQISNLGRVRSIQHLVYYHKSGHLYHHRVNSHILSPYVSHSGYAYVALSKKGHPKKFRINRLVALMFVPNPHHYPCVNHKDENKLNNRPSNLEWCTVKYNDNYGSRNIRSVQSQYKPVILIKNHHSYYFKSFQKAGKFVYNHSNAKSIKGPITHISAIYRHMRKSVQGFHCEFPKEKKSYT